MSLTVLIGGARSGKSTLAVEIGSRFADHNPAATVTFVATAPRSDDDMDRRIERHIAERPHDWTTVEEAVHLADAINRAAPGLVIVDCLTLWTSNLMWIGHSDDDIAALTAQATGAATHRRRDVVVVSNEVGLGIVPDNDSARRYRDVHGRVNQGFVAAADRALYLVAGRAMPLVDPATLLG